MNDRHADVSCIDDFEYAQNEHVMIMIFVMYGLPFMQRVVSMVIPGAEVRLKKII